MEGRWRGDGGEMEGRWRGDMEGRHGEDGGLWRGEVRGGGRGGEGRRERIQVTGFFSTFFVNLTKRYFLIGSSAYLCITPPPPALLAIRCRTGCVWVTSKKPRKRRKMEGRGRGGERGEEGEGREREGRGERE